MFDSLYLPQRLGRLEVKNDFVRSATYEGMANDDGSPTEDILAVYEALAKGEVGVIITSYTFVADYEQPTKNQLGLYTDDLTSDFIPLVECCHKYGAKVIMQLVHGSNLSQKSSVAKILGPSAFKHPNSGLESREASLSELEEIKLAFADAAHRAKMAGFDGVQIHAAHGYLLSQFLSPTLNQRKDAYGGTSLNRARFVCEVIEAVREKVGEDFPLWIKMDSNDKGFDDLSDDEVLVRAECFKKSGIDVIEVSGTDWRKRQDSGAFYFTKARFLQERLDLPIVLTGGLRDRAEIERILSSSALRYFGFSRPFLKAPDFIKRLKED